MPNSRDLKFLNALNSIPNIGAATLRMLKNKFGSYEAAWRAEGKDLESAGLPTLALRSIPWKRPSINPDKEMERLVKEEIWVFTDDQPEYPSILKEIPNPPVMLYGRGVPNILKKESLYLAVVGTRRPTTYGLEATEKIVHELAVSGVVTVSGLATGIDSRAHEATLDARGVTIAVLGSGLDPNSIFPPENIGLARRIAEAGGAVISEYSPGTPAVKEHFPMRNRIISGLSRGVVVVEAREKSGALITARLALEQNRDVFAVPGSVFSLTSAGPHALIKEGAKIVASAQDILEEYGMGYNDNKEGKPRGLLEERESIILELLEEPQSVDFIKEKIGLDTAAIVASLSLLELKGFIKNLGGDTYQKMV
ncbi:MAG: DNA-protecting protein DprA [Candidatus Sungiibacteriota bacterium]|uniref:DNA-protecting protein DprA n=1 Tax=Candidatus Sungiibacteriota bacterium TaxID=2750080 RepID=A0A7T5UPL6_9BACT|nr:MAG: DNA-protecting protein DprA [Candidatus Sungbacteria bacterium]